MNAGVARIMAQVYKENCLFEVTISPLVTYIMIRKAVLLMTCGW